MKKNKCYRMYYKLISFILLSVQLKLVLSQKLVSPEKITKLSSSIAKSLQFRENQDVTTYKNKEKTMKKILSEVESNTIKPYEDMGETSIESKSKSDIENNLGKSSFLNKTQNKSQEEKNLDRLERETKFFFKDEQTQLRDTPVPSFILEKKYNFSNTKQDIFQKDVSWTVKPQFLVGSGSIKDFHAKTATELDVKLKQEMIWKSAILSNYSYDDLRKFLFNHCIFLFSIEVL